MIAVARHYAPLDEERTELLRRHAGLPAKIAQAVLRQNPWLPESMIDFDGIANAALHEAVRNYKTEYKNFTLFATIIVRRRVLSTAYQTFRGKKHHHTALEDQLDDPPPDHSALFEALDVLPKDERAAVVDFFGLERSGHNRPKSEKLRKAQGRLVDKALANLRKLIPHPQDDSDGQPS